MKITRRVLFAILFAVPLLFSCAQMWVNHDKEQNARIPKAPAYVE